MVNAVVFVVINAVVFVVGIVVVAGLPKLRIAKVVHVFYKKLIIGLSPPVS